MSDADSIEIEKRLIYLQNLEDAVERGEQNKYGSIYQKRVWVDNDNSTESGHLESYKDKSRAEVRRLKFILNKAKLRAKENERNPRLKTSTGRRKVTFTEQCLFTKAREALKKLDPNFDCSNTVRDKINRALERKTTAITFKVGVYNLLDVYQQKEDLKAGTNWYSINLIEYATHPSIM